MAQWNTLKAGLPTPPRDWDILENELIFRDLAVIENRLTKLRAKKKLIPEENSEKEMPEKCFDCLDGRKPLRKFLELKPEEWRQLRGFSFVTSKPEVIVLNLDDSQSDETKIPKWNEIKKRADEQVAWSFAPFMEAGARYCGAFRGRGG